MMFQGLVLAAVAALASAQETPTLVQALNSTSDLSMLNELITGNQELATTLGSLTNFTILAPNNQALEAFTAQNNASLANPDFLPATIMYHVITGTYLNFTNGPQFLETYLTSDTSGQYVNLTEAQVVEAQLVNETATFISGYKQTSSAVGDAVPVQNGVVYVIDTVLTLPGSISSTATELNLSSAVAAIVSANLTDTVDTTEDLTIFVPNNEAFQSIGSALPGLTTDQLADILQYHVHSGVLYSTDLSNTTVDTLQGNSLNITVYNSTTVYVNNARVVVPDVLVANGVVHVIDEVLNPENATAPPNEPNFPGATASGTPFEGVTGTPTPSRTLSTSNLPGVTSTSTPGAAWQVRPTGLGAALLAGVVLVL